MYIRLANAWDRGSPDVPSCTGAAYIYSHKKFPFASKVEKTNNLFVGSPGISSSLFTKLTSVSPSYPWVFLKIYVKKQP